VPERVRVPVGQALALELALRDMQRVLPEVGELLEPQQSLARLQVVEQLRLGLGDPFLLEPGLLGEPAGQAAGPHRRAVGLDLVLLQQFAMALLVADAVFACRRGGRQCRGSRVTDLAGQDSPEHGVQLGVDLGRASEDGLHLDLQGHGTEESTGVRDLDHLAVLDPVAVLRGVLLSRLDATDQLSDRSLSVVNDLHGRGQPCGQVFEFLTTGAQVVVRCFRRIPGPACRFGTVELVLQADDLIVLRGEVVTDLPDGVRLPLPDLGPGRHQRPIRPKPCPVAPSCASYALAAVVSVVP
jgi:hypothetical protein